MSNEYYPTLDELRESIKTDAPKYSKPPKRIGMDELAILVADLARDIKVVRQTQDLTSATTWAAKQNKRYNTGYKAETTDLNRDGIPEVVVRDKRGRLITVNGYTTVDSSFPDTYMYGQAHPYDTRKKQRKQGITFPTKSEWLKNDFNNVRYDAHDPYKIDHSQLHEQRYKEFGGKEALIQKHYKVKEYNNTKTRSAYSYWTDAFFKPLLLIVKQFLTTNEAVLNIAEGRGLDIFKASYMALGEYSKIRSFMFLNIAVAEVVKKLMNDNMQEVAEIMTYQEKNKKGINKFVLLDKLKATSEYKELIREQVINLVKAFKTSQEAEQVNFVFWIFSFLPVIKDFVGGQDEKISLVQEFIGVIDEYHEDNNFGVDPSKSTKTPKEKQQPAPWEYVDVTNQESPWHTPTKKRKHTKPVIDLSSPEVDFMK